jgi:ribosomal protein L32
MGVAIADEIGKRRRIHGLCSACGYETGWALLRS